MRVFEIVTLSPGGPPRHTMVNQVLGDLSRGFSRAYPNPCTSAIPPEQLLRAPPVKRARTSGSGFAP